MSRELSILILLKKILSGDDCEQRSKCAGCLSRNYKLLPWRQQKHPLAYKRVRDALGKRTREAKAQEEESNKFMQHSKKRPRLGATQLRGISNGSNREPILATDEMIHHEKNSKSKDSETNKKKKKKKKAFGGASTAAEAMLNQNDTSSSFLNLGAALRGNR